MSRPGTPKSIHPAATDPRFPFPHTAQQTRCQRTPQMFDFANGDRVAGGAATDQRIEAARAACARCPLAADCLLWALVNKDATHTGIWAGTTPRDRNRLRARIADRLGARWIDVLADRKKARQERAAAARHTPLTVAQARIVRMDRDMNGPMPALRTLTPSRRRRNRERLAAAATTASRARSPHAALAEAS
ncbi:WhiB family transcriptional regulator [Streptomyces sp. NPDC059271]|uniref:WhiB family transcriptional regulator n=1 Tax=Streptomyces sp. NPDC059271 TaxID=3346799 RepID=UPI00369CF3BB